MDNEKRTEFSFIETLQKILPKDSICQVAFKTSDHHGYLGNRTEVALTERAIIAFKLDPLGEIESDYPGYSATRLEYLVIAPQENDLISLATVVEKRNESSAAGGGVHLYVVGKIDQSGNFTAINGGEVLY